MSEKPTPRGQAISRMLRHGSPMEPISAIPHDAMGQVASHNITAFCHVPEQPCSLRDGYAVRVGDIEKAGAMAPVRLAVTQTVRAESLRADPVESGQAARVLTGGLVPPCADAVLAEEDVELDGDEILVRAPVRKGWFVRPEGGEIELGSVITRDGSVVTPQAAAVMVRTRSASVHVYPSPRARVLSLGSELSDPDGSCDDSGSARFPADNLVLARGLLAGGGADILETGVLPDDLERLVKTLSDDLPEVVVTTGGTGRSERDFARLGAQRAGFTIAFDSVDMRPGRNMFGAYRDNTLLFGLPGPPIAVFTCFHGIILPVLRKLRGLTEAEPVMARFEEGFSVRPGSEWLVPCALQHKGAVLTATPLIGKRVPPMLALGHAHGVAVIEGGDGVLPGGEVKILSTLFG